MSSKSKTSKKKIEESRKIILDLIEDAFEISTEDQITMRQKREIFNSIDGEVDKKVNKKKERELKLGA